jgi:hypothetical protein
MTMAINSQNVSLPRITRMLTDGKIRVRQVGTQPHEVKARIATYTFLLLSVFVPSQQGACLQQLSGE